MTNRKTPRPKVDGEWMFWIYFHMAAMQPWLWLGFCIVVAYGPATPFGSWQGTFMIMFLVPFILAFPTKYVFHKMVKL